MVVQLGAGTRSLCMLIIMLWLTVAVLIAGLETGTDQILPGPMSRSRDSIAIAESFLKEWKWNGFAAYREVLLKLDRGGLTLDTNLAKKNFGTTTYQSFLFRPDLVNAAILAARQVEVTHPEQLWFVDGDDVGMASYFILAFAIFGHDVSSLYYLYVALLSVTVLAFCLQFWRHPDALILPVLCLIAIHSLVEITLVVEPDVNAIHSSRFIPILGFLGVFHILLLSLYRFSLGIGSVLLCALQALIVLFVIHCRFTGAWMVVYLLTFALAAVALRRLSTAPLRRSFFARHYGEGLKYWPFTVLAAMAVIGSLTIHALKHPTYTDTAVLNRHIFWQAFITVLHNNPNRTAVFGIEKTRMLDPRGDGLGFFLFERHVKANGLNRADYVSHDSERNRLVGIDYEWKSYDRILGKAFWKAVWKEPGYALASFLYYQPIDVLRTMASLASRNVNVYFTTEHIVALLLISLLYRSSNTGLLWIAIGSFCLMSFVPTMAVAPNDLRLMEPLVMILITMMFVAVLGLATTLENAAKVFLKVRPKQ